LNHTDFYPVGCASEQLFSFCSFDFDTHRVFHRGGEESNDGWQDAVKKHFFLQTSGNG
jgi:hypothetical protein